MKKSKDVEQKEDKNKKVANTNPYLCALSDRLPILRNDKGLSQQELAKQAGTIREKIMYAELNLQGRVLKADELAGVAKVLGVSTDYLLGISNSITSNSSNGLSDTTNNLAVKMGDNKIVLLDKMIPEVEDKKQLDFLQAYLAVAYINKNVIPHIITNIQLKTTNHKELTSVDIQKVEFLLKYVNGFQRQTVEYSGYVKYLFEKNEQTFRNTFDYTSQLFFYQQDKNTKINYEIIKEIQPIFSEFENYAKYEVLKRFTSSIEDMIYNYIKDDTYFNEIRQHFTDITPIDEEHTIINGKGEK